MLKYNTSGFVLMNGKQKRIERPPTVDGMDVDEFIRQNADPIWLHQNEMWEYSDDSSDDHDWQDQRSTHHEQEGMFQ